MRYDPSYVHFSQPPKGFLVLEGVNGAGKSTLQNRIAAHLTQREHTVVTTREPGATTLGKTLRSLVLERSNADPITPMAELFLFAADRSQHVETLIRPALLQSKVVISDRYFYSTIAFQGFGRGLDPAQIASINALAVNGMLADLVIVLDTPPEIGLARAATRTGGGSDAFEREDLDFHRRIRSGFLELAMTRPKPFVIIDATRTPDQVWASLLPALQRWEDALLKARGRATMTSAK